MVLKVVLSKVVCRQETETDGEPISLFFLIKLLNHRRVQKLAKVTAVSNRVRTQTQDSPFPAQYYNQRQFYLSVTKKCFSFFFQILKEYEIETPLFCKAGLQCLTT